MIASLTEHCAAALGAILDDSNVFLIFDRSLHLSVHVLSTDCHNFIDRNAVDLFSSDAHLSASADIWKRVVRSDGLCVREYEDDVYRACVRCGKARCEDSDLEVNEQNVREKIGDTLYDLRLACMGASEFETCIEEFNSQ